MALSSEVERILEDIKTQNGDDLIDEDSALLLYGGKPSTFNQLTPTQKLQYALIVTAANRDALADTFSAVAKRHNELIVKYNEAVAVIQRFGNRKARRHPWEAR